MEQKSSEQFRQLGNDLFNKVKRNLDDEGMAISYFKQAIETRQLSAIQNAECNIKCSEIYRDRIPKTSENFDTAILYLMKASHVKGLPSWFAPQRDIEKLAMCPEIYGFPAEKRNKELAWDMHKQIIKIQNGGDLNITAGDWFNHIEGYNGEIHPEWLSIGLNYLNKAIDSGWDDLWTSILYCNYGRFFKYYSMKTTENFNLAVEWFKKAIDLNVNANDSNQPWTIIGKGSARAYFELAELLLNPTRFGFDVYFKNAQEGENQYKQGKEHLKKYATLGPYSILESMFIDVWKKKFNYARIDEDIQTVEDLCKFGKSLGQDKNAHLSLFEAVFRHCLKDRSDQNYTAIAQGYYDCLQACKSTNEAKGWIAENGVKWASQLVLNDVVEVFSPETKNLEITKKLLDFLNEISKNPGEFGFSEKVKEIIDANSQGPNSHPKEE